MQYKNEMMRLAVRAVIALSATTATAVAQQSSATTDTDSVRLEEVIVTAQKREERLQDVPVAVTAVTSEAIENSQFTNLSDIQYLAPTVQYTGGSAPSYQIRGVGTNTFDFAIENSVGVQVDGVPQMLPRSTFINNLVDVDRIEVLRGPQGTLFGKNTSAGVMTVNTAMPKFDGFSDRIKLSYGSRNEIEASNVFNVPLSDTLAWRTALSYRDRDGFVRNLYTGKDIYARTDYAINSKFLWKPNEEFKALLIGDYQRHKDDGYYVWTIRSVGNPLAAGSPPITFIPLNYIAQTVATYGITPGPDNMDGAWNSPIYNRTNTTAVTLQLDYDLGNHALTSITGWRNGKYNSSMDSDSSPLPFYEQNLFLLDGSQYTQEFRIASSDKQRVEYVLGAFYSRFKVDAQTLQTGTFGIVSDAQPIRVTSSALGGVSDFHVDNVNYALFGQSTINLTDSFRLIVGARGTRDEVDSTFQVLPVENICQRTFATTGVCYSTPLAPLVGLKPGKTGWSGKFGAQYDVTKDVKGYATISRGYKGISVNNVNGASTVVDPETSENYELGLKSEFFDRRLSANIAVYYSDFKDFQAQTLFVINGVNQYSIGNAGGLTSRGVELELAARATTDLTMSGSVIYNKAEFTDFITQCYPLQTVAQGCLTPPGSAAQFQAKGYALNNAPEWTLTASANYQHPITAVLKLDGGVNAAYKDDVYFQVGNSATIQKAYTIVNVNLGLGAQDELWHVGVYARNLFDQHYVSLINPLIGTVGGYHNRPAEGAERTVGMSIDLRFGAR
jgi:iron complex outermembrane receptor protein